MPSRSAPLSPDTAHDTLQDALREAPPWLHDTAASRTLEAQALAEQSKPGQLMAKAGLATARLALAVAPHAPRTWVLTGPGHNGGDGLIAAGWLQQWGRQVDVLMSHDPTRLPPDAHRAFIAAQASGARLHSQLPPEPAAEPNALVIDALLGLGQQRAPAGAIEALIAWQGRRPSATVLAIDVPTGLCSDTGRPLGELTVSAQHTLSLLTLKPGLFTHHGRDASGHIWWHGLGLTEARLARSATATLARAAAAEACWPDRRHAQHKGSFGDLWVIAGASGMEGAARLSGRAALTGGAGRVYLSLLAGSSAPTEDTIWPELMHRATSSWQQAGVLESATVVCGCGGGEAVAAVLPEVLTRARRLVLDADALNAIAASPALKAALQARRTAGLATVLTPHPLEAARLAGVRTADIQANRLRASQSLADALNAVVLLKGAGTVTTQPANCAALPAINTSGNARLATPGSGDVLAGWLGAAWSAMPPSDLVGEAPAEHAEARWRTGTRQAAAAATAAAWVHGAAAERMTARHGGARLPLRASQLIDAMAALLTEAPGD